MTQIPSPSRHAPPSCHSTRAGERGRQVNRKQLLQKTWIPCYLLITDVNLEKLCCSKACILCCAFWHATLSITCSINESFAAKAPFFLDTSFYQLFPPSILLKGSWFAAPSIEDSPVKGLTWTIPATEAWVTGHSQPSFQNQNQLRITPHVVGKGLLLSENPSRAPRTGKHFFLPFKDEPCAPLVTAFPVVSPAKDSNNSDNSDHCAALLNVWASLDAAKCSVIASTKQRGYSVLWQLYHTIAYPAGQKQAAGNRRIQKRKLIPNTYKYKEIEKKHQVFHAAQTVSLHGLQGPLSNSSCKTAALS